MIRFFIYLSVLTVPSILWAQSGAKTDAAKTKEVITYKDHIAVVLRKHCAGCHNPDKATSDLNVMTYQTLMAGGSSGEAIAPGSPDQSLLYRAVSHAAEPFMPQGRPKLPEAELALIRKWIELGAPETAASAAKISTRRVELDTSAASAGKPEGPAPMPQGLPEVSLSATKRPHPITAMAVSPWAPLVAVAGHERVMLFHTDTLKLIGTLPFPERIPHVLKFSRNGKLLLVAGGRGADSGKVVLFDVVSGKRVTEIGAEEDAVLAADISANHKWVALGGSNKLVKIYSAESGELKHRIKKHTDWVTSMEFNPEGNLLASGDRNGGIYVWDAEVGGIVFTLGDHKESISGLSWRSDSQMLASSSEDGRLIVWFAEDGFPTRSINAHADANSGRGRGPNAKLPGVLFCDYSRSGLIATVGRDKSARVWRPDGSQVIKIDGFTDLPSRIAFTPDGERVIVGDFTGQVRVWAVKDKQLVGELSTAR